MLHSRDPYDLTSTNNVWGFHLILAITLHVRWPQVTCAQYQSINWTHRKRHVSTACKWCVLRIPHSTIQNNYLKKNRRGQTIKEHWHFYYSSKYHRQKRPLPLFWKHSCRCNTFYLFINSKTLSKLMLHSTAQHIIKVVQISSTHWISGQKINHNENRLKNVYDKTFNYIMRYDELR